MAKYLVTLPPGAPVPGLGFVKAGQIFEAPPKYVPSRTMWPCDKDAVDQLQKLKDEILAVAKRARGEAADPDLEKEERRALTVRARTLDAQAKEIHLDLYASEVEAPKIKDGVSLKELDELQQKELERSKQLEAPAPGQPQKSGRAADK